MSTFWNQTLRAVPVGLDVLMVRDNLRATAASTRPAEPPSRSVYDNVLPYYDAFATAADEARAGGAAAVQVVWGGVELSESSVGGGGGEDDHALLPAGLDQIKLQLQATAGGAAGRRRRRLVGWGWAGFSPHSESGLAKALYAAYRKWWEDETAACTA